MFGHKALLLPENNLKLLHFRAEENQQDYIVLLLKGTFAVQCSKSNRHDGFCQGQNELHLRHVESIPLKRPQIPDSFKPLTKIVKQLCCPYAVRKWRVFKYWKCIFWMNLDMFTWATSAFFFFFLHGLAVNSLL